VLTSVVVLLALAYPQASETPKRIAASDVMGVVQRVGAASAIQQLFNSDSWESILDGIAGGGAGWLRVAAALRAASDGHVSEDLASATSEALVRNPAAVLRLTAEGAFRIDDVCGWQGFLTNDEHATNAKLQAFIKRQREAVMQVESAKLRDTTESCLALLHKTQAALEASRTP
jgi:hypothetical protein